MTPEQISLIQGNWSAVAPIADKAAEIFYGKLFEAKADLKYLFRNSNMSDQGKKLMQTLGTVVAGLTHLDPLIPVVQDLGKRHVDYGVTEEDYPIVGAALLDTLEAGLGDSFTPECKEAWATAYGILTEVMIKAAAEVKNEGPITLRQKVLVQETWKQVAPIAAQAADIFYGKLFTLAPQVRSLFPEDMSGQKNKLMQTLAVAINTLDNLENLVPILQDLGRRHNAYQTTPEQYPIVGQALLETLEAGLGEAFTLEVKEAWTAVYGVVASVMIEAQKNASTAEDGGPLSAKEVELVQSTWAKVVPIAGTAADLFYGKLFELDPNLKPLFKGDLNQQKEKLMKTLGTAVASLTNLPALVPVLQDLGKTHVGYGVQAKDYGTVGEALLDTLGKGLGEVFTPEVKTAWTKVYTIVAQVMQEAAATVPVSTSTATAEKPKGFFAKLFGKK